MTKTMTKIIIRYRNANLARNVIMKRDSHVVNIYHTWRSLSCVIIWPFWTL